MQVKATLCFNFGPSLVFVPMVVGTDETGAALATAVNITYKLVFTHTELEILDLIIYFKVYDPKQTTETNREQTILDLYCLMFDGWMMVDDPGCRKITGWIVNFIIFTS